MDNTLASCLAWWITGTSAYPRPAMWATTPSRYLRRTRGRLPGAIVFEGNGTNRCNCQFAKHYPFAIGPRLGAAYQVPKTVLRAGAGVVYSKTANNGIGIRREVVPNVLVDVSYVGNRGV
jgi:hypothetical protein